MMWPWQWIRVRWDERRLTRMILMYERAALSRLYAEAEMTLEGFDVCVACGKYKPILLGLCEGCAPEPGEGRL